MTGVETADRIQCRLVDLLNEEREAMIAAGELRPFALVSALCLTLLAVLESGPRELLTIAELRAVESAARAWLGFYLDYDAAPLETPTPTETLDTRGAE